MHLAYENSTKRVTDVATSHLNYPMWNCTHPNSQANKVQHYLQEAIILREADIQQVEAAMTRVEELQ